DAQLGDRSVAASHGAIGLQVVGRRAVGKLQMQELDTPKLIRDTLQVAVVKYVAVADYQHTPAEGLDVAHVVTGQEHGHAAGLVVFAQALLDLDLADDVQAD